MRSPCGLHTPPTETGASMTSDLNAALAEAYSPDANRAGQDASARLPERLAHLLRLLVLCVVDCMLAVRPGRARLAPARVHDRPDLPPGSAPALAASPLGSVGTAIAWTCRRFGMLRGHPDWPEVSRAPVVVLYRGVPRQLRRAARRCPDRSVAMAGQPRPHSENDYRPARTAAWYPGIAAAIASLPPRLPVAESPAPAADDMPGGSALVLAAAARPRSSAHFGAGPAAFRDCQLPDSRPD